MLFTLIAVAGLVVLIARFKVNPILAIVLAALFIGLTSGMELAAIMKRFTEGVGSVLGSIAMILGLGSVLGKIDGVVLMVGRDATIDRSQLRDWVHRMVLRMARGR